MGSRSGIKAAIIGVTAGSFYESDADGSDGSEGSDGSDADGSDGAYPDGSDPDDPDGSDAEPSGIARSASAARKPAPSGITLSLKS